MAQTRAREAQDDRGENMRMPNVSIEGERQTPDIFFVFPTGKGGNLSAPRFRDYSPDILDPVVKPWFERDQSVNPQLRVTGGEKFDWDAALRSEPDRAPTPREAVEPPPQAAAPMSGQLGGPSIPPPQIPSRALSLPPTSQPQIPSEARSLPSTGQPSAPAPAAAPQSPDYDPYAQPVYPPPPPRPHLPPPR